MKLVVLLKGAKGERGIPDGSGPTGNGPTGKRKGDCPKIEDYPSQKEWHKAYEKWKKKRHVIEEQTE